MKRRLHRKPFERQIGPPTSNNPRRYDRWRTSLRPSGQDRLCEYGSHSVIVSNEDKCVNGIMVIAERNVRKWLICLWSILARLWLWLAEEPKMHNNKDSAQLESQKPGRPAGFRHTHRITCMASKSVAMTARCGRHILLHKQSSYPIHTYLVCSLCWRLHRYHTS